MIVRYPSLIVTIALITSAPLVSCLSTSDIPSDTSVSSLISSANAHLQKGNYNDALTYFDAAISRNPDDYLPLFKRGVTYLSLGKHPQAVADFNRVLDLKPDFEGALVQRAKIRSKNADWAGAKEDYERAGRVTGQELVDLEEAQSAADLATEAEKKGDWESCITNAGVAIMTASTALGLRQLRARCRFERGDVREGVGDLAHVVQINPALVEPHLQMSAMLFYSLGDTERGLAQIRKCLHSDPDSKACSKLFRGEKVLNKKLDKAKQFMEKRQFNSAAKLLVKTGEDAGLIQDATDEVEKLRKDGVIHPKAPNDLVGMLNEMACEAYVEMNNHKRATPFCTAALTHNPYSLPALLHKAQLALQSSDHDLAISTLTTAEEHHPSASSKISPLLQKAHTLLRQSKTKDYYKVLDVSRDADDRTIKRAYRSLTKHHHPDKAIKRGVPKEEAEKKMAAINEAYEVLGNPELKARFDAGDDPNSAEGRGQPFQGAAPPWFFNQGAGGGQQFVFRTGGGGGGFKFQQGGGAGGGFQFPGGFQF